MRILLPVFLGIFFAIVLNPLLNFIEKKLKIKYRGIAIAVTYLLFIILITVLFVMIIPAIPSSVSDFISDFPHLMSVLSNYIIEFYNQTFENASPETTSWVVSSVGTLSQKVYSFATSILNTAISSAINVLSTMWNIIISLFISIYILHDKEHFENLFCRTCHSFLEEKKAKEIIRLGYNLYSNLTNFIAGKLLDSMIICAITYIVSAYIIRAPYSLLIAAIVGITNMIPYFGPFIGGVPATIITLLFQPVKGIWMGIFIILLQQFDGWFLGPKILGIKLDLKPIWIIISIIIGGGFFGPAGMFLATPFAALIKTILEGYMTLKLKDKQINLPHEVK